MGDGVGGVVGGFEGGFVGDVELPLPLEGEVVAPLVTVGLVVPPGFVEEAVFVEGTALAAEPIPPLHPQPQRPRVIRKMRNRKNRELSGLK